MTKRRIAAEPRRFWSAEEDAQLRARYPHERTVHVATALGRTVTAVYGRVHLLGLEKTEAYLASPAACRTNGRQGISTRFKKGQVPPNKGLRRPGYSVGRGRMQETQFKKGTRSGVALQNYKPIGFERISKDGYLERKINDDLPFQRRWRAVHLQLWESVHGPLPKGHAIVFVNGDKRDIRIENLACVTRGALMKRNTIHNLPKPLAHSIQLIGAINRQIRRRARAQEEQDRRPA